MLLDGLLILFAGYPRINFHPEISNVKSMKSRCNMDVDAYAEYPEILDRAQTFIGTLMSPNCMESIPNSRGMRVLKGLESLETTSEQCSMVIRNSTEPFWKACIETVDDPGASYRVCAVGTPGTGKTATTPFLIRMLLERKETVVYHTRAPNQKGWIYEFVPIGDEIVTTVFPERDMDRIVSLLCPSTYYIVEPGQTKDSCNPKLTFRPKVIIVASLDANQWGDDEFMKRSRRTMGVLKFFPLWELDEILSASEFMDFRVSKKVVLERFRQVGGIPRLVFTTARNFRWSHEEQEQVVKFFPKNHVRALVDKRLTAVALLNSVSTPPQRSLIGFANPDAMFEKADVVFASYAVKETLLVENVKDVWGAIKSSESYFATYALGAFAKKTLSDLDCFQIPSFNSTPFSVGTFYGIRPVTSIMEAVSNQERNVLYHLISRDHGLIDFIYRDDKGRFHAFLVSLKGRVGRMELETLLDFEKAVGEGNELSIYILVPERYYVMSMYQEQTELLENAKCSIFFVEIPMP